MLEIIDPSLERCMRPPPTNWVALASLMVSQAASHSSNEAFSAATKSFFAVLLAASLTLAAACGGTLSAVFVFLGAFTYGIVYTVWLKRRSAWNIVVGGLAGSFAVLAGAAAVDPSPQVVPYVLAVALFLWTPPHFWSLAAAKGDDYAKAGVPMLPIVVPASAWTLAILLHTAGLAAISLIPLWFGKGWSYGLGAGIGGPSSFGRALFCIGRQPSRMRWQTSLPRCCNSDC